MALLAMRSLSGSLPVLFIEARLQGPPEIVLSQMGVSFDADKCNIALLMRTSGVLLVASVGSYVIYRVCARLLGRDFVWTILEQARFDLLTHDEKFLRSPKMALFSFFSDKSYTANEQYDRYCSPKLTDSKRNAYDGHFLAAVSSSSSYVESTRQLYARSVERSRRRSEMNSEHEKHPVTVAPQSYLRADSQSSPNAGFSSSEKSVSLHLLWDDPQWDEETSFCFYDEALDRHSVSSNVSDMPEFRAAKGLFEEPDDRCKVNKELMSHENSNHEERNTDSETNDFIRKNCMIDSKHLYQITTGFVTRTNSISVSSEHSSQSFPSLRQRFIADGSSAGLLELVQVSGTSPMVSTDHMMVSMTDSGISRGTVSTSHQQSLIRRNNLNLIGEDRCSTATSSRSMEWFEDDYCVKDQVSRESLEVDMDDPLTACFSHSISAQTFPSSLETKQKHLYTITRDLMVWARDHFLPQSSQLKALKSLYISDQRWRRIGLKQSSNPLEQFLGSLLQSMFIRGIPFFNCPDVLIAAKAIQRVFLRYEFMQQWSFTDGSSEVENKEGIAIGLLQNLWDLQHGVKYLEDERFERYCIEAVRLLVLLWIVHCFEKMETGQWQQQCPNFYVELFGKSNPRQIFQSLYKTQLNNVQMTLLADTLRIRLEILDCSNSELNAEQHKLRRSSVPHDSERLTTSRPTLTFLKLNHYNSLYPLLYIN